MRGNATKGEGPGDNEKWDRCISDPLHNGINATSLVEKL